MTEVTYGFVDENNILQQFATVTDGDLETLERLKSHFNLPNAYKMNLDKEFTLLNKTYWNGTRFLHPSPFPSWVFNEEKNNWMPPVPYPLLGPKEGYHYEWSEHDVNWIEIPIEE